MPLELTMICAPYDRARALIEGAVKPEGIDLRVHVDADDVSRHFDGHGGRFDVAEFFTGRYIVDLPFKTLGFTAVPIFVKRMFRHSYIYVNTGAGITDPTDLNGKRVGIQSWFTTTALWARGILEEEYGVDLKSITWVAGRPPENPHEWSQPEWLRLEVVEGYGKLREMLLAGDIDAMITTATLAPDDRPRVDFLFPDYPQREREYYRRTGFFPIQHTLLIRNSVLDRHPGWPAACSTPGKSQSGVATSGWSGSAFIRRVSGTAPCGKKSAPPAARIATAGASGKPGRRWTRCWNTPSGRASRETGSGPRTCSTPACWTPRPGSRAAVHEGNQFKNSCSPTLICWRIKHSRLPMTAGFND